MLRDECVKHVPQRCLRSDLQEQTLLQVAGSNSQRVESLNELERLLSFFERNRTAEHLHKFRQRALQPAVRVQVLNQILAKLAHHRRAVEVVELVEQILLQRLRSRLRVRHHVVLAVGILIQPVARRLCPGGVVVVRPFLRDLEQTLEVGGIVVVAPRIDLAVFHVLLRGVFECLYRSGIAFRFFRSWAARLGIELLEQEVLRQFLIDSFLKLHRGKLQDLHRLNHARSQLHLLAHPHLL